MEKKNYYIFKNGNLKRKENTLFYEYFEGKEKKKIFLPVKNIDALYLFGETNINTKLLNFISREEILLHIFNYYGFYSGSFIPRKLSVSGVVSVLQAKSYLDEEERFHIAKEFVDGAIFHILRNLREYKVDSRIIESIEELRGKLNSGRRDIEYIMSIEGNVRDEYYKSFNSIIKREGFFLEKREKRPPKGPINAMISFGNSLLYTTVLGEIYKTQLDPTISFLHALQQKRFSLALDIAEIFKPLIVDPVIFSLINNRVINLDDFDKKLNYSYLNESGRRKFLEAYENKISTTIRHRKLNRKTSYKYLIRLECYKLIKHFIGEERYKSFKAWW